MVRWPAAAAAAALAATEWSVGPWSGIPLSMFRCTTRLPHGSLQQSRCRYRYHVFLHLHLCRLHVSVSKQAVNPHVFSWSTCDTHEPPYLPYLPYLSAKIRPCFSAIEIGQNRPRTFQPLSNFPLWVVSYLFSAFWRLWHVTPSCAPLSIFIHKGKKPFHYYNRTSILRNGSGSWGFNFCQQVAASSMSGQLLALAFWVEVMRDGEGAARPIHSGLRWLLLLRPKSRLPPTGSIEGGMCWSFYTQICRGMSFSTAATGRVSYYLRMRNRVLSGDARYLALNVNCAAGRCP